VVGLVCCNTNQPDTPPAFKSSNTRFSHNSIHRQENIGRESGDGNVSLDTLLSCDVACNCQNLLFNIDIEGSEYQILDALVENSDRIEGLTIEFHDVDRNIPRIHAFIRDFPLALCHVHANNYALVLDDRTPTVVECSFTRRPPDGSWPLELPHRLDSRNDLERPELAVEFRATGGADRN